MKTNIARRKMLKGLGVSLALPWLETFAPQTAKAQANAAIKRYMSVYFPNGTSDQWWFPSGTGGAGANWQLSPILEPLTPLKQYVTVLKGLGNYSPFGGHVEPSHGHNSASTWTGVRANGPNNNNNGISVDQIIGNQMVTDNNNTLPTTLHSLQLGVSTIDGSPDGIPPQHSHSASWKSASEPLYKIVSPQAAFDRIVGSGLPTGGNTAAPDPLAERRRALKQSALDYVFEQATDLQTKLSVSDQAKVQEFLDSVRTLEMRVASPSMPGAGSMCSAVPRPLDNYGVGMETTPDGSPYNRGEHVTLMTDLLVMAVQCDITRVYSYMLDDARSEFVYSFFPQRSFTDVGSTVKANSFCGNYHGAQHGSQEEFASITYFIVQSMADLATKLAAIQEGDSNALSNSHITFTAGMHGSNHDGLNLPTVLIGGGGGVIKTDQFIDLGNANLADVHYTVIKKVFNGAIPQFGTPQGADYTTAGTNIVQEILA